VTASATESGYTMAELLMVLAVVLVLMVIVVPGFEHTRRMADESQAITSLKTLNQSEGQYGAMFPTLGFACSLSALGSETGAGKPTPDDAELIPNDLASGVKAGYRFTISGCGPVVAGAPVGSYRIAAVPLKVGSRAQRGFCTDQTGKLRFDPKGGTDCTDDLQ
jgi:type IV pilus assembly protein PilA